MQDSIQQGTQKNTFVAWDRINWITLLQPRSCPIRLSPFSYFEVSTIGRRFRSNEEVRHVVKNFLRSLGTDFSQKCFLKLISRYDKFIYVGGEYVEKIAKGLYFVMPLYVSVCNKASL
ncbi:hypothetical protein AVEN_51610-1 [Araneus ventricosus]|uniref:Uncharacterized protein n=1 Tax=Araneus ventricosus TaxID=182803 RepID=A0A4Y2JTR5_ARAVE|nr:hypothetical protein AVEN_51610-1 [Araneus ventricosus]